MVSEEIKKWLEEAKKRGYTNDQIKAILEKQGYQRKDFDEILSSKKHFDFIKKDIIAIILIILIIIIGALGVILSKTPATQLGGSENINSEKIFITGEFPDTYGDCTNKDNRWCFTLNYNNFNPINCFEKKEECDGDRLKQIAIKANDFTICNNIELTQRKDICFGDFALKNKNLDLCKKITNEEFKEECLYLVILNLKNKDLCEKLSSEKKEECISYFA